MPSTTAAKKAALKANLKKANVVDSNVEVSSAAGLDSDLGSAPDSEQDEQSQNARSRSRSEDSDSDSLDSDNPRKRRRTSPPQEIQPPIETAFTSVPSRIKRNQPAEPHKGAEPVKKADPPPATGVTAPIDANTTFESLGVRPWLVQALANMRIKRPTAIQRESIPMLLLGRDCIGGSRTGSGKTVAFSVPILQKWAENPSAIFGVILTPTR